MGIRILHIPTGSIVDSDEITDAVTFVDSVLTDLFDVPLVTLSRNSDNFASVRRFIDLLEKHNVYPDGSEVSYTEDIIFIRENFCKEEFELLIPNDRRNHASSI